MRRPSGPALTAQEIADVLVPVSDPLTAPWHHRVGTDGSKFRIRLSADPGDLAGPAVAGPSGDGQRDYDCFIHVSIYWTTEDTDDSLGSLRAFCRSLVAELHSAWPEAESAFEVDDAYSYRILPELSEGVVDLRLGSEAPLTAPGFSLVEAANRAASGTGLVFAEDEPNRHLAPSEDAGDSVTYTVSSRAEELPFAAGARSGAAPVDARQLDGFTERLLAELARHTAGADLACWVNDRLYRYEVELTPLG
ncbi:hypothetical protein DR950_10105 [Kitasatospora xanthocidica]|uniref:Uncharacterized protein n=1 Tax=Kitasatospora xanthocidica TaxID=83382 RepID=A0A372ZSC1_9ACTN|nr:hypothetical protein DR950_10105 [Kitasatospora xanthocidica]